MQGTLSSGRVDGYLLIGDHWLSLSAEVRTPGKQDHWVSFLALILIARCCKVTVLLPTENKEEDHTLHMATPASSEVSVQTWAKLTSCGSAGVAPAKERLISSCSFFVSCHGATSFRGDGTSSGAWP